MNCCVSKMYDAKLNQDAPKQVNKLKLTAD